MYQTTLYSKQRKAMKKVVMSLLTHWWQIHWVDFRHWEVRASGSWSLLRTKTMWPFKLNCQNLKTSSRSPNLSYPISHFLNRIIRVIRKRDPQSRTVAVNRSQRRLTRNGEDFHPRIMSLKLKWRRKNLPLVHASHGMGQTSSAWMSTQEATWTGWPIIISTEAGTNLFCHRLEWRMTHCVVASCVLLNSLFAV